MIAAFLQSVAAAHKSGAATEHSYRPALERLFNGLADNVTAINEPKREKVGAPDFVFRRGDIVIGHCEAKDLDVDLNKMKGANADQKKRYTGGLSNLIYTNCLDWVFFRDGEQVGEIITIADYVMGVQPNPDRFAALEQRLREFIDQRPQTITSSKRLAERMAGKAILIKDILANALLQDKDKESDLYGQYDAFRTHLIHDISIGDFADLYAETIAYGMFAARLHDTTLNDFSRQEAMELLPKSNPFLRNLFGFIAGPDLDDRIRWVIDDLAEVFQATDVRALMEKFGSTTQRNDPFLHFYETFLAAYNPKKRKARGVWYTPEPVVNFIVRAVDDVLENRVRFEGRPRRHIESDSGLGHRPARTDQGGQANQVNRDRENDARSAPGSDSRSGDRHGHISRRSGQTDRAESESIGSGHVVELCGERSHPASARV